MHPNDALSEADVYPSEWVPIYYCEACGCELHFPPESGCCYPCELKREDEQA